MSSCQHQPDPFGKPAGLPVKALHISSGALNKQTPDILVASLADTQQVSPPARAVLARHKPNRSGEIAATPVLLAVAHLGSQHAGSDRTDAGNREQPLADLTCLLSSDRFNLGKRPRLLQLNNTAA